MPLLCVMSIKTRVLKHSDKMPDPPDKTTVKTKGAKWQLKVLHQLTEEPKVLNKKKSYLTIVNSRSTVCNEAW